MVGSFHGQSVLVTGGGGFIGSNLVHRLAALGAKVTVVDARVPYHGWNPSNLDGLPHSSVTFVADALEDLGKTCELVSRSAYVFNLLGQTGHQQAMDDPRRDLEHNCLPHLTLLEACRRSNTAARIVFTGTRQVYGRVAKLPVSEDQPPAPVDMNGIHKLAAENYHRLYAATYGLRICCLRLTNTYGPRMRIRDGSQNFLGAWIRALVTDQHLEVWGGGQSRDYSYVDDVVSALLHAASESRCDGGVFNVGGCGPITHRELAEVCVSVHGSGSAEVVPFPPGRLAIDIGDYLADDRRFRDATGWRPEVGLQEGLERTFGFYRDHLSEYL